MNRTKQVRFPNLSQISNGRLLMTAIAVLTVFFLMLSFASQAIQQIMPPTLQLLTDPFLQLPTPTSVRVIWFTEFEGDRHTVNYGQNLQQEAVATTTRLTRMREDEKSRVGSQTEDGQVYTKPVIRPVWRHEAEITGLVSGQRSPYQVISSSQGGSVRSEVFTLAPLPQPGTPLKILLTSDHQLMPMTATNLQKAAETLGQVDAVFLAGDLVNIPDRASEWFDDNRGGAFFPCLQGRGSYELEREGIKTRYRGGALIQHAPLFPVVGNHEVMGRFSMDKGLNEQFGDPYPKPAAATLYAQKAQTLNPTNDPKIQQSWLKENSFNTDTFQELFSLPVGPGQENYYAITFGDVRLVSLFVTNIWRGPELGGDTKGRYRERDRDLEYPERWGYGQHIFEPIARDSAQYNWLQAEVNSPEFRQAKYKVVMFHHPAHSLGDNIVPAYTNPVQFMDRDANGRIKAVRYEYPLKDDYLIRDVMPLLESAGVQLVYFGHSHLWNRFTSGSGMHFLESSNVGNTYGAFTGDKWRPVPVGFSENYATTGDPNGLEPIVPAIAPLLDDKGAPQPFISSNDITVFTILDTGTGTITSYRFDTRQPNSSVLKFDEFQMKVGS